MKLYLFNPDTDLALANHTENYMAPASARRMAQDLAVLPVWYAEPGSSVLAPSAYNADFLQHMRNYFPLQVNLVTPPELPEYAETQVKPWGWNLALRKWLLKNGLAEHRLPGVQQLDEYRMLSGRNVHVHLLDTFSKIEGCCGAAKEILTTEACCQYVKEQSWCVFKAPWSGSGKGLRWCYGSMEESTEKWCERTLREQGFLVASPIYNKVCDFAMEYYSDGQGRVTFIGYSLFETNKKGAYQGNVLLDRQHIEHLLTKYFFPLSLLVRVREHLQEQLACFYGQSYTGYIGVDMMACSDQQTDRYWLYPCVEVNLRMNMGVLSCLFTERYLAPNRMASFQVAYFPSNEALHEEYTRFTNEHPLEVVDGRLLRGFLPLVPITPQSRYLAYVLVKE